MKGYINSIETMGLVDGPGIRVVVFLQGCKLRCIYCHNPETWELKKGVEITPEELVSKLYNYKPYFSNGGGVTFSGGEPLLQPEFLIETLKLCKKLEIHTCLDTSGVGTDRNQEVLKYVDLVILDVKSSKENEYTEITGGKLEDLEKFIDLCNELNKKMWVRQVIVPGINDTKENIMHLKKYLKKINNLEKVELLPYHTYGLEKYNELGIAYKLNGVFDMEQEKLLELYKLLVEKTK